MKTYDIGVLLLDDEQASLDFSKRVLASLLSEGMIHTARTLEEAMDILQTKQIQLAFLDIELTFGDGFSLCQFIHREHPEVKVAMLTGHVELGAKSYEYEAFDFLVKPVDVLRVEQTLQRFCQAERTVKDSRIAVETGDGIVLLNADEILYISKSGNNCYVHCQDGQEHRISSALDKMESMLERHNFFRTHQSFLVNMNRVRQVRNARFGKSYEVYLDQGVIVPVSRGKHPQLKERLLRQSIYL